MNATITIQGDGNSALLAFQDEITERATGPVVKLRTNGRGFIEVWTVCGERVDLPGDFQTETRQVAREHGRVEGGVYRSLNLVGDPYRLGFDKETATHVRAAAAALWIVAYERVAHAGMVEPQPYRNLDTRIIPREEQDRAERLYRERCAQLQSNL